MNELKAAYADFLQGYSWDWYSTVTVRRLRRDPIAAAAAVWSTLESKFCATRAFVAAEGGPGHLPDEDEEHDGGRLHLHLLSQHYHEVGSPPVALHSLWLYLFKAYGRTRVEPIRSAGQVSSYCAKYVSKGEQFNLFGEPQAWVPGVESPPLVVDPLTIPREQYKLL